MHKCECPYEAEAVLSEYWYEEEELKARVHPLGNCPGDYNVKLYDRRGQRLWLCSACCFLGDIEVTP